MKVNFQHPFKQVTDNYEIYHLWQAERSMQEYATEIQLLVQDVQWNEIELIDWFTVRQNTRWANLSRHLRYNDYFNTGVLGHWGKSQIIIREYRWKEKAPLLIFILQLWSSKLKLEAGSFTNSQEMLCLCTHNFIVANLDIPHLPKHYLSIITSEKHRTFSADVPHDPNLLDWETR